MGSICCSNGRQRLNVESDEEMGEGRVQTINYFSNFLIFCALFAVNHATVDGVLAYASSELGPTLGSYSGFVLYGLYALTTLLISQPFLHYYTPKCATFIGMCGFLLYVSSFLCALMVPSFAAPIFLTGSALGGTCAGLLWVAQGSYYSANALYYAKTYGKDLESTKNTFAAIFAAFYLGSETSFKLLASVIYIARLPHWRDITFSVYTACTFLAVTLFSILVVDVGRAEMLNFSQSQHSQLPIATPASASDVPSDENGCNSLGNSRIHIEGKQEIANQRKTCGSGNFLVMRQDRVFIWTWEIIIKELSSVMYVLCTCRKLQLMVPYQITFGLASGFVNYYVNRVIVSGSVGDGYIGLLSALSTLAAVVLAFPLASIANRYESGKYYVMVFGGMCFVYGGLSILLFNESHMGNWAFLLTYFIIHGAARGVWESTNKAVISSYFSDESTRNAAFATVYFTSGLSATFGFLCYQFLTKFWLSLVNTVIPLFAMFCYHYSHKLAVYRCIDLEPLPVTVVSIVNPVINDSVLIDESEGGIGKRYESTTTNRTSLTNSTHYTATPTEDVDNSVTSRTNRQLK